ncbi:MAG TPA: hypothetical protein VFK32_01415, partial [Tepidiformaceae bacterium]|nr:hypothetical protein [Tepidiformaceae bacterium]
NRSGYDPDGLARAYAAFDSSPPLAVCPERLVLIPILRSMPANGGGSTSLEVLGVATFGIAKWTRAGSQSAYGTSLLDCSTSVPTAQNFECGMVWGFLMGGLQPPNILLEQIGDSDNPFAPLLIALVD